MVDWNGDGTLTDDLSSRVVAWQASGGSDSGSDLVGASKMSVLLDNRDGYFSPHNPTGALYGLIPYGKEISLTSTFLTVTRPIFRGRITDFSIDALVTLSCGDDSEYLREETVRLTMQENKTVDQLIGAVLDAVGWSAGRRNLDVSRRVVPYFWAWDQNAWDTIRTAAKQELGGAVYMDRNGDVRFEASTYRPGLSSSRTLSDSPKVRTSYKSTDLWNRAEFTVGRVQAATAASALFTMSGASPIVPSTGSLDVFGAFSVGARGVVTPVIGVDILGNSQADGSGTDKSSQLSLTSFTPYGGGFKAVIANSDSSPTYLKGSGSATGVTITGYAVRSSSDDRLIAMDAVAPVIQHHTKKDSFDYTNDEIAVRGFASYILSVSNSLSPRVSVILPGRDDSDTVDVLSRGYSDLITIDNTTGLYQSKLSGLFHIEGWQMSQEDKEPVLAQWILRSKSLGLGAIFRVSPAKGGAVYSAITTTGGVSVDRIGW